MATNKKNHILKVQVILLLVVVVIIVLVYITPSGQLSSFTNIRSLLGGITATSTIEVNAPLGKINVELANTPDLRERGLSGRTSMSADHGMLFVFQQSGVYGFWMKDMNYPLDMVWVDANHRVVSVNSDIATSTYPDAIFPAGYVLYVIELNAGVADKFGIATGTVLDFDLK